MSADGVAAGAADDARGQRQQPRALQHFLGLHRIDGQHVAALVLAEPDRVRRQLPLVGEQLDADAAGQRHLGDGDEQAAVRDVVHGRNLAFADQRAHEAAGLDLVGEIDRRRRAFELAGRQLLVERLAEVARLAADDDRAGRSRASG